VIKTHHPVSVPEDSAVKEFPTRVRVTLLDHLQRAAQRSLETAKSSYATLENARFSSWTRDSTAFLGPLGLLSGA
jgi:hypothetical protein